MDRHQERNSTPVSSERELPGTSGRWIVIGVLLFSLVFAVSLRFAIQSAVREIDEVRTRADGSVFGLPFGEAVRHTLQQVRGEAEVGGGTSDRGSR